MTFSVNNKVLRFEVSMDNAIFVQMLYRQDNLSYIQFRPIFLKVDLFRQKLSKISSR